MKEEMKVKLQSAKLYGIVDLGYVDEANIESAVKGLLSGGADLIQLRAKQCDISKIEEMALLLLPYCQRAGVPFIVNDHPEIAVRVGADGIHVGQDDGSLARTRAIVGDEMIVGRSTHSRQQAEAAMLEGFDYIGFGPLYETPTKAGRAGIGTADVFYVENKVGAEIPVFCIGGIKRSNVDNVITAGASRVVIVSDLLTASSIESATKEAKSMLEGI